MRVSGCKHNIDILMLHVILTLRDMSTIDNYITSVPDLGCRPNERAQGLERWKRLGSTDNVVIGGWLAWIDEKRSIRAFDPSTRSPFW